MVEDVLHLFRGLTARDRHHHGKKQMVATFGSLMIVMAMAEVNIQAKAMWHPTLPIIIIVMIMVVFSTDMQGEKEAAEESLVV